MSPSSVVYELLKLNRYYVTLRSNTTCLEEGLDLNIFDNFLNSKALINALPILRN